MQPDRILTGMALMLGFCLTAPLIDVASKLATVNIPVGQITTARFIVQAALMLPICLILNFGLKIPPGTLVKLILRALFLILSTYSFVAAVQYMPIADALAIAFVEPFILLILGHVIFGDAVGPRRIGASIVGFCGSLLVIQPSLAIFGLVALWPLGTAFSFAAYMLVTRSLGGQMHPVPMQYHTATVAIMLCLPVMILANGSQILSLDPVLPTGLDWLWLIGVGAASAFAHMLMTYALRYAPSATLAPLHYLEIISASTIAYFVFGDFPDTLTWAGIGIIAASGLYIIHRERITARQGQTVHTAVAPGSGGP